MQEVQKLLVEFRKKLELAAIAYAKSYNKQDANMSGNLKDMNAWAEAVKTLEFVIKKGNQ
jgi:hypothetical protein